MTTVRISREALAHAAKNRPAGYLQDVESRAARSDAQWIHIPLDDYQALRRKYMLHGDPTSGPGTELKALLAKFGINSTPTCSCNRMARQMDTWGDECVNHIEEIVDVMEAEARKRKLPFLRTAGRLLVRKAIRNAKRKATGK